MSTSPIRQWRNANNVTLAALAEQIGVIVVTVWRWEHGRLPDRAYWARIEAVTGITAAQLVNHYAGVAA